MTVAYRPGNNIQVQQLQIQHDRACEFEGAYPFKVSQVAVDWLTFVHTVPRHSHANDLLPADSGIAPCSHLRAPSTQRGTDLTSGPPWRVQPGLSKCRSPRIKPVLKTKRLDHFCPASLTIHTTLSPNFLAKLGSTPALRAPSARMLLPAVRPCSL